MFHSFGYPDETGEDMLVTRFWFPVMKFGIIEFNRSDDESNIIKKVRPMTAKVFNEGKNFKSVEEEYTDLIQQPYKEDGMI